MTHLTHTSLVLANILALAACSVPTEQEEVGEARGATTQAYGSHNGPILLGGPNEQSGSVGEAGVSFTLSSTSTRTVTASFFAGTFDVTTCTRATGVGLFHCLGAFGSQLVGTQLTDSSGRVLTITGTRPHNPPAGYDKPSYENEYDFSLTYAYSYFKAGRYYTGNANYCQGATNWAIPVPGQWDGTGAHTSSATSGTFSFACLANGTASDSAAVKCVDWGYKPWGSFTGNTIAFPSPAALTTKAPEDVHQACTRMARADYKGDGTSHTYGGTPIELYDIWNGGIPLSNSSADPLATAGNVATGPAFVAEAGWTTNGSVCQTNIRARSPSGYLIPSNCWNTASLPESVMEQDQAIIFSLSQIWGVPLTTWQASPGGAYLTSLATAAGGTPDPSYGTVVATEGAVINQQITSISLSPNPTTDGTMTLLSACNDTSIGASGDIWLTTTNPALCGANPNVLTKSPVTVGYVFANNMPIISGGTCNAQLQSQALFSWKNPQIGYRTATDPNWDQTSCLDLNHPGSTTPVSCALGSMHCHISSSSRTCDGTADGYTYLQFEGCLAPAGM